MSQSKFEPLRGETGALDVREDKFYHTWQLFKSDRENPLKYKRNETK